MVVVMSHDLQLTTRVQGCMFKRHQCLLLMQHVETGKQLQAGKVGMIKQTTPRLPDNPDCDTLEVCRQCNIILHVNLQECVLMTLPAVHCSVLPCNPLMITLACFCIHCDMNLPTRQPCNKPTIASPTDTRMLTGNKPSNAAFEALQKLCCST